MNLRLRVAITLIVTVFQSPSTLAESGYELPKKALSDYVWDLESVFPTDGAIADETSAVMQLLAEVQKLADTPVERPNQLARLMAMVSEVRGRAGKLASFGLLQSAVNNDSEQWRRVAAETRDLESKVAEGTAFLSRVLLGIGEQRLRGWLQAHRVLDPHQRRIFRTLALADYVAELSEGTPSPPPRMAIVMSDLYAELNRSDLNWPTLSEGGEEQVLSPAVFRRLTRSADSERRRHISKLFFEQLGKNSDLYALALSHRIGAQSEWARSRNLGDSIDTLLVLNDGFQPGTHRALFEQVRALRPVLADAVASLKAVRGQDALSYLDLFTAKHSYQDQFSVDRALSLTLKATAPLGSGYRQQLLQRLQEPWIHLPPSDSKDALVGVFWQVGGGRAYSLMPYGEDYRSARTLAASVLLMMAYRSVPVETPPDVREEDLPVFSNAIWYLGRDVFDRALLSESLSSEEQLAVQETALTQILHTLIRGTMVGEFEWRISQRLAAGEALRGQDLSALYRTLIDEYFGATGVDIPDWVAHEWMGHSTLFYGPHYTSWSLAKMIATNLDQRIVAGDPVAIAAVTQGIGSSKTHLSSDVLRSAEIDLSSAAAFQPIVDRIRALSAVLAKARP